MPNKPPSMIDAKANKIHIELRRPEFGVSVLNEHDMEPRIALKLETLPFDLDGGCFNGAFAELTVAAAHRLVSQLERGISLVDRAVKQANAADTDARFK